MSELRPTFQTLQVAAAPERLGTPERGFALGLSGAFRRRRCWGRQSKVQVRLLPPWFLQYREGAIHYLGFIGDWNTYLGLRMTSLGGRLARLAGWPLAR